MHPLRRARRLGRSSVEAGVGAAAAYFLDPEHGPERRARALRAASAFVRRAAAQRGVPRRPLASAPVTTVSSSSTSPPPAADGQVAASRAGGRT